MIGPIGGAVGPELLAGEVARVAAATALGLFIGLEREWSRKSAGVRTFALIAMLGAVFTLLAAAAVPGGDLLVAAGAALVVLQGAALAGRGLLDDERGLALTTSASMLAAYGVGVLVAADRYLAGVVVAVLSAVLLVFKRELHSLALGLDRTELRSVAEFAILAFVVLPLLPTEPVGAFGVEVDARAVWAMVVFVAAIGIVNYVLVANYGGRGIAVTGFVGGLASSTAVVGSMVDHARQDPEATSFALAGVLLANAAMALRNLAIVAPFALSWEFLLRAGAPLGTVVVGGVVVAAFVADWSHETEVDLDSPFSTRNALAFGAVFLCIVVVTAVASARLGAGGFLVAAALSGLVSSAGAAGSGALLYQRGAVSAEVAVAGILAATAVSIAVKSGLVFAGGDRRLARRVTAWSTVLVVGAGAVALAGFLGGT
jgi:uncharacterized membrane protein (DUF4010 family)